MVILFFPAFFLFVCTSSGVEGSEGRRCYSCGYARIEGKLPIPLENITFCEDTVNQEALSVQCNAVDDCCVILDEKVVVDDESSQQNLTVHYVYHGCFQETPNKYDISCKNAEGDINDGCKHFDEEHEGHDHNEIIIGADVCVCKDDLCNNYDPITTSASENPSEPTQGDGIRCYNCGYEEVNGGKPQEIANHSFCGDFTQASSFEKACESKDDCCSVISVHENRTLENGETQSAKLVWHGCFNELEVQKHEITCADASGSIYEDCKEFVTDKPDEVTDNDHIVLKTEICLCKDPLCNNHLPETTPDTSGTTTEIVGPHSRCYNCGYRQIDGGNKTNLPDEPDTMFCNGFIDPDSLTTDCKGENDCCAIVKIYSDIFDEETNANHSSVVVRHGCANELDISFASDLECIKASEDIAATCQVIDKENIPDGHGGEDTVQEEICICKGELCNNEVPPVDPTASTENPPPATTTTAGGSARSASQIFLLGLLSTLAFRF